MSHPLVYEVNTRCWLQAWAERLGRDLTLATVPEDDFKVWAELGFTHIWLMGVWTPSPRSRAQALADPGLRGRYDAALPGWREKDVPGSPYAIGAYEVSAGLGGNAALAKLRKKLGAHGLQLILDFVPNHLGLDHPWVAEHPDWLVNVGPETPGAFDQETNLGLRRLAHGRDPYFDPWPDTVQIDYRRPEARAALREVLRGLAKRCDGVRCDMAMLLLNEVFARTWAAHPPVGDAPAAPAEEFWAGAIADVKERTPEFVFLAEAYWGLEGRLQELGFDYTYDKPVYDCLTGRRPRDLQRHLLALDLERLARGAHFLENHDEPRVATLLTPEEHRAAALVTLGLPGMRLLHEGELAGARLRLPVQLGRRPPEPTDRERAAQYQSLLVALADSAVGRGEGRLLTPRPAWAHNPTAENFVVVQWREHAREFDLVVVNLAPHRGQCRVALEIPGRGERNWCLRDRLGPERWERAGSELAGPGLYLDLPAHGAQVFQCKKS